MRLSYIIYCIIDNLKTVLRIIEEIPNELSHFKDSYVISKNSLIQNPDDNDLAIKYRMRFDYSQLQDLIIFHTTSLSISISQKSDIFMLNVSNNVTNFATVDTSVNLFLNDLTNDAELLYCCLHALQAWVFVGRDILKDDDDGDDTNDDNVEKETSKIYQVCPIFNMKIFLTIQNVMRTTFQQGDNMLGITELQKSISCLQSLLELLSKGIQLHRKLMEIIIILNKSLLSKSTRKCPVDNGGGLSWSMEAPVDCIQPLQQQQRLYILSNLLIKSFTIILSILSEFLYISSIIYSDNTSNSLDKKLTSGSAIYSFGIQFMNRIICKIIQIL